MKKTLKSLIVASLIAFTAGSALAYTQTYSANDNDEVQLTVSTRSVYETDEPVDVQLSFVNKRTGEKPRGLGVNMSVDNGSARQIIAPNSTRTNAFASAGELTPGTHSLRFTIPEGCGSRYTFSRFNVRTLFDDTSDCDFTHTVRVIPQGGGPGCTDKTANNYSPLASFDDGSCTYDPDVRCEDPAANNTGELGGCTYDPDTRCTDRLANNFGERGRCTYDDPDDRCLDGSATNTGEEGPCEYDPGVCNYENATNAGGPLPCVFPPTVCSDVTAKNYGEIGTCDYLVFGCTEPLATNYDPRAEANDGSCILPPNVDVSDFECSVNNSTWFPCEGRTFTLRTSETPIYVRTEPRNAGVWSDWCTGEIGNGVDAQFTELTNNGDNARVNFTFTQPGAIFDMVLCLDPESNVRAQSHQNIKLKVIDMTFREN